MRPDVFCLVLFTLFFVCRADQSHVEASRIFKVDPVSCKGKNLDLYLNDARTLTDAGMSSLQLLSTTVDFSVPRTQNIARNAAIMFGTRSKLSEATDNLGDLQSYLKDGNHPDEAKYSLVCGREAYTKASFAAQLDGSRPYVLTTIATRTSVAHDRMYEESMSITADSASHSQSAICVLCPRRDVRCADESTRAHSS